MTRADLEAAAEERYPIHEGDKPLMKSLALTKRASYIQGRLDQAEADARIADAEGHNWSGHPAHSMFGIAAAIREGVE